MPKRIQVKPSGDQVQDTAWRGAKVAVDALQDAPISKGVLKERVALGTAAVALAHSLGRVPRGFLVVDSTVAVTVHRDSASTADRAVFLALVASAPCTVSLWIF